MASEKARLAKEKGNAAFKAADYAAAVGHYTTAILADRSDITFHLNRAAAYLRLGKNEDAERDCTNALALSPKNVKALYRIGQARRALGKLEDAQADLQSAITLEPSNSAVRNELIEVEKALQEHRSKQRKTLTDSHPVSVPKAPSVLPPKRRRVPIEIIEGAPKEAKPSGEPQDLLLEPATSRFLKQDTEPPAKETPPTFADIKRSRESLKPVRVSGGIFRPSGNHTIVTRTPQESPASASVKAARKQDLPVRPPTTLFQFSKSWETLRSDDARWELMRTIPTSSIPALFQASLEPDLLKSILHTFKVILERHPDARNIIWAYLSAMTKVERFATVLLFMNKEEKRLVELLRANVDSSHSQ